MTRGAAGRDPAGGYRSLYQRDGHRDLSADARPLAVGRLDTDVRFDRGLIGSVLRYGGRGPGHRARAPHRPVRARDGYQALSGCHH